MDYLNCGDEEFITYQKIARLSRDCVITEKIDGTNAQILIRNGIIEGVGSRSRYLTIENDNFGFARWVDQNKDELLKLGEGRHFGEWWGVGIQRHYNLSERRFSLFRGPKVGEVPKCVSIVPTLYEGLFNTEQVQTQLNQLQQDGSKAAPGFMKPEGIVIYHKAADTLFKKTIDKDEEPKGDKNVYGNFRTIVTHNK